MAEYSGTLERLAPVLMRLARTGLKWTGKSCRSSRPAVFLSCPFWTHARKNDQERIWHIGRRLALLASSISQRWVKAGRGSRCEIAPAIESAALPSRPRHVSFERIGQGDGQFSIYRSSALSWDGSMKQFQVCKRLRARYDILTILFLSLSMLFQGI
jgi:hypothetical protein